MATITAEAIGSHASVPAGGHQVCAATRAAIEQERASRTARIVPIYTPEERVRRDTTVWTTVQAVLAPLQFLVFVASLGLVLASLVTGALQDAAAVSVILKTGVLYTIMVTGAIWEKVVFGRYLFAPSFFWEDVVSMGVIALHTAYVVAYVADLGSAGVQFAIALVAYAAYVANAGQFLIKMVRAKRAERATADTTDTTVAS